MKITAAEEIGRIIKARRKKIGYTQAYLSELTGLSISFISDVENGKPTVELEKVIDLASLLGLDILLQKRG